ncbi:MAG: hypothetical protein AABY22_23280 [Nanoarchaeota archaeon]
MARKLKTILKSKSFWKSQAWLGGFILGIPFFISGRSFSQYLSELNIISLFVVIIGTIGLGLFTEFYLKQFFK